MEPKEPDLWECIDCDGCGWYEGGKAIVTNCEKCNGTGVIDKNGILTTPEQIDEHLENHKAINPYV